MNLKNKRIVVTGGTGFLGSHIVDRLVGRGADVFVPYRKNFDLTQIDHVRHLYEWQKPEIVIHCAAKVGGIGANIKAPAEFFYDNLIMGCQMMHEGWVHGIEKFVAIGTTCSYPAGCPLPFAEEFLWNGMPEETNAPYGLAKKMLIVQSMAYRKQYGFNSINILPANLYGPRDNFDLESSHVIAAMIAKFLEAKRNNKDGVPLWGDGTPTRDFLYVEDAASGIVKALELYNGSEPVNLGSGTEISIKNLAEKIAQKCHFRGEIIWDKEMPIGQSRRWLNIDRAFNVFGFQASTSLDNGLKKTIRWFEKHHHDAI